MDGLTVALWGHKLDEYATLRVIWGFPKEQQGRVGITMKGARPERLDEFKVNRFP